MGSRRNSRICALQTLFGLEINPLDPDKALRHYWDHFDLNTEVDQRSDEIRDFTATLVRGVVERQSAIDDKIQSSSKNWKLNRMAIVDRNILRLAVYELLNVADIPKRVSINEAIELGKKFGSEDSGSFINGVLDKISQGIEKE